MYRTSLLVSLCVHLYCSTPAWSFPSARPRLSSDTRPDRVASLPVGQVGSSQQPRRNSERETLIFLNDISDFALNNVGVPENQTNVDPSHQPKFVAQGN